MSMFLLHIMLHSTSSNSLFVSSVPDLIYKVIVITCTNFSWGSIIFD